MNSFYLCIYILISILIEISSNILPKCCIGSEDFGINKYSLGTSCSNKKTCCLSGTYCYKDKCVSNKYKRKKRKLSRKKNKDDDIDTHEIKKKEVKQTKTFSGPVRIDWKTFSKCLTKSKSNEPNILEILNKYKKGKESEAMKIVFSELKDNNQIIVDCLNNQEHLH